MEATPLASLSLTHVHYVGSFSFPSAFSPSYLTALLPNAITNYPLEPLGPNLLPLRLARPRPPNAMRHLRNPHLVHAGSGNPPHVRRANGLRGA